MKEMNGSELFNACRDGDEATVKRLLPLTSVADLNRLEPNGRSCLHVACDRGHVEITQQLIDNGSSRVIKDKNGHTPFDQVQIKEILELSSREAEAAEKRYAVNPYEKPDWLFGQDIAEAFARAIARGCVKDRGVKKTVKKILAADNLIPNDQSEGNKLLRFYLNEARDKNDATFLLKAYTIECPFYRELNDYMATGKKRKVYKKLCHKWSGYYTGALMRNPTLEPYRFSGITYRGMEVTHEGLKQYKVGGALTNKTFQSTSKSRKVALRFAIRDPPTLGMVAIITIYEIRDQRSALDIRCLSEFPDEEEVLLVPGCLFKVISIDDSKSPYNIHLRQILTHDA
jgi:hypothetical protein